MSVSRTRPNLGLLALLLMAALAIYAFWIEPRSLRITRVTLTVAGLSAPIRLTVIGDVQPTGPHETPARLQQIMAVAQQQGGDVVLLLGDYVSTRRISTEFVHPRDTTAIMGTLSAPLGVYAVLGNHDWWWNGPEMRRLLTKAGIRVLEDAAVRIGDDDRTLWIAGLQDPVTRIPDLPSTLAQTDTDAPVILLSHSPDVFPDVPASVALTLAGHTHAGQVWLPILGRLIVPSKYGARYAYGHIVEDGRHLYVTSGIGTALLPVRFLAPPEIAVITLLPGTLPPGALPPSTLSPDPAASS